MREIRKDMVLLSGDATPRSRSVRRASLVMHLYFKYMFETLLERKLFNIKNFGTLAIEREFVSKKRNVLPTPRYYKTENYIYNERMLNKRMVGQVVRVVFKDGPVPEHKARFRVCYSFRKGLTALLFNTEYGKTIPLCQ